jgi:hypothetical protein
MSELYVIAALVVTVIVAPAPDGALSRYAIHPARAEVFVSDGLVDVTVYELGVLALS